MLEQICYHKGGSNLGRVPLTPTSDSINLAVFQSSTGGSFCHERNNPWFSMVFNTRQRCTIGDKCTGEPVVKNETKCVYLHSFYSYDAGHGHIRADFSNSSSSMLEEPGVVCGSDSADSRLPMGNPSEQRLAFSIERISFSLVPLEMEVVGLAPEREYLLNMVLSQAVVSTIQSSQAVSARSLYSAKWHAFNRWCAQRGEAPTLCAVGVVL